MSSFFKIKTIRACIVHGFLKKISVIILIKTMWVGSVHYTLHPMIFEFTKSCYGDSERAAGTFTGH